MEAICSVERGRDAAAEAKTGRAPRISDRHSTRTRPSLGEEHASAADAIAVAQLSERDTQTAGNVLRHLRQAGREVEPAKRARGVALRRDRLAGRRDHHQRVARVLALPPHRAFRTRSVPCAKRGAYHPRYRRYDRSLLSAERSQQQGFPCSRACGREGVGAAQQP